MKKQQYPLMTPKDNVIEVRFVREHSPVPEPRCYACNKPASPWPRPDGPEPLGRGVSMLRSRSTPTPQVSNIALRFKIAGAPNGEH
jgi:hypothetical protein